MRVTGLLLNGVAVTALMAAGFAAFAGRPRSRRFRARRRLPRRLQRNRRQPLSHSFKRKLCRRPSPQLPVPERFPLHPRLRPRQRKRQWPRIYLAR